jgi:hypothetical protein
VNDPDDVGEAVAARLAPVVVQAVTDAVAARLGPLLPPWAMVYPASSGHAYAAAWTTSAGLFAVQADEEGIEVGHMPTAGEDVSLTVPLTDEAPESVVAELRRLGAFATPPAVVLTAELETTRREVRRIVSEFEQDLVVSLEEYIDRGLTAARFERLRRTLCGAIDAGLGPVRLGRRGEQVHVR